MKKRILFLLTVILSSCAVSANAEIFWSSNTVKGGDHDLPVTLGALPCAGGDSNATAGTFEFYDLSSHK